MSRKRSVEEVHAHAEALRTKKRKSNADRIFLYLYKYGEHGRTRHEIVDGYFFIKQGDRHVATDGGRPIPWQSMASPVIDLREDGWIL